MNSTGILRSQFMDRINTYLGYFILFLSASWVFLFFSCAGLKAPPEKIASPIIRVGILQNQHSIEFEPLGSFYIITRKPRPLKLIEEMGVWKAEIKSAKQPEKSFRILLNRTQSAEKALEMVQDYKQKYSRVERVTSGERLMAGSKLISDNRMYSIYLTRYFSARSDAEDYIEQKRITSARIVEEITKEATGEIRVISPSGKFYVVKDAMRITGPHIRIRNIDVGTGYHFQTIENRTYRSEIEIAINGLCKLDCINVLPFEDYLKGVVPGEMITSSPIEALKAQAVASRTFFMYNFGRKHESDNFDVCADVHCQAYVGVGKETERASRAVNETRGLGLTYKGDLCLTPYSAVCGGHTEHASNAWNSDGEPYLRGVFDVPDDLVPKSFDLKNSTNVHKWVHSEPNVFCNLEAADVDFANYAKKYFRWKVRIQRYELEELITKRTGTNIGTLLDMTPLERGVSGRIIRLEIQGTRRNLILSKELNIRKTLSSNTLFSSCFTIEKENVTNRIAETFVLGGAGWGHGVGMCQIGASVMAFKGYTFDEILRHYYQGTEIKVLY